jgi:hypothetical protein
LPIPAIALRLSYVVFGRGLSEAVDEIDGYSPAKNENRCRKRQRLEVRLPDGLVSEQNSAQ